MDAEVIGKIAQQISIITDLALDFIFFQIAGVQLVYFFFRQSKYFTQFAQNGLTLKSGIRSEQAYMFPSIPFEYVIDDLIPVFPGKVQDRNRVVKNGRD